MTNRSAWNYPNLGSGVTFHHITDTHIGYRDYLTSKWHAQIADDIQDLRVNHVGHIHTGDFVETWDGNDNDSEYVAFRDSIKTDDLPWADVPGNHDQGDYNTTASRTADEWAQQVGGREKARSVTEMSGIKIIGLPVNWGYPFSAQPLTEDDLTWLDEQLTAAGSTPCWLAAHEPPYGAISNYDYLQPTAQLNDIVGAHSNVFGGVFGHWHMRVEDTRQVQVMNLGGRDIFIVNGPSGLGIRGDYSADQQAAYTPATSLWVTMLDDGAKRTVDVRWRNHLGRRWVVGEGTGYVVHQEIATT